MNISAEDIKNEIKSYSNKVVHWYVLFNSDSQADFNMGYFFDANKGKWITYQNGERGFRIEKEFDDELSALIKLNRYVKYEYKIENHLI